jgi:hypothetical protein
VVKTALCMIEPHPASAVDCRVVTPSANISRRWTVLEHARVVIRPFLRLNARSTSGRVQGPGAKAR